jgi:hypothetical protein
MLRIMSMELVLLGLFGGLLGIEIDFDKMAQDHS